MSIPEVMKKIKLYWSDVVIPSISKAKEGLDLKTDTFIIISIIFIGLAGFGLGKLSTLEKGREVVQITPAQLVVDGGFVPISSSTPKLAEQAGNINTPMTAAALVSTEGAKGLLVASKNGTKYHFPWCAGASQIAEKNKIWFASYVEAQRAGYSAASNCKGLK